MVQIPREEKRMAFLADVVGDEYKKWLCGYNGELGARVYISAPTGAGKTFFALNVFAKHFRDMIRRNVVQGRILYLVNRKVLEAQIKNDIEKELDFETRKYIDVKSYQKMKR